MNKVVLITGASRGIGRAAAVAFWNAGCRVAVNYCCSRERAESLCHELNEMRPDSALAVQGDVSNSAAVRHVVRQVEAAFGQIDILVCNAGVAKADLFTDITDETWQTMFATNVDGVFYMCRAVLPGMIHRKSGSIITVSSMWGLTGGSCEVAYSATKAAVIGLTRALAKEVGPSGIRVNCVAPGVIDTEMNGQLGPEDLEALRDETPLERIGKGEDVAKAMVFLASDQADFITGQVLSVDGGMVIG